MAVSEKSLKNLEKRRLFTPEIAGMYGKMGHAKSEETKKRKKALTSIVAMIAQGEVTDANMKEALSSHGIEEEGQINNAAVALSLYKETLTGSVPAIRTWNEYCEKAGLTGEAEISVAEQALIKAKANYFDKIDGSFLTIGHQALNHYYTHYDVSGGRGSTKSSWASLTVVRILMEHPNVHALVLRKVAKTLRNSVFSQYKWAINQLGVKEFWVVKTSPMELIYKPTGQKILFLGADNPSKIKSIKPEFGYIGITHFEEKDQFAGRVEIDNILQSTMRGGQEFWNFETYNPPRSKDNWANRDSEEEREDRIQHSSSYLDLEHQEWLSDAFIKEAENLKNRDEMRYQHEYLGQAVGTGGNVFENLELRTITDEEIRHFDHIYQGVDWGWFPDPFAFIRLHYDKTRETIYFIDEHFGLRLTNESCARWIKDHGYNDVPTICDSAEQKSISDFRNLDVKAKEAVKGPSSVEYGMKWLQSRTIVIDKNRTPNAYREFSNYQFEQNKNGEWISGYPDQNNHLIDATRYALEKESRRYRSCA